MQRDNGATLKIKIMRKLCAISVLVICITPIYSQDVAELERSLDSLNTLKLSYQLKLSDINQEFSRIQNLIIQKRFEQTLGESYYCISGTTINKSPTGFDPVGRLNYGSKVKILDQTENRFKIFHNDTTGWVIKAALYSEKEYNELIDAKQADAQTKKDEALRIQKEKEDAKTAERVAQEKRKTDLINKYGSATAQKILDRKIWLGMTSEMAIESWGKPNENNRSIGSWGVHEQWVYGSNVFLYFENGKLTSWQD